MTPEEHVKISANALWINQKHKTRNRAHDLPIIQVIGKIVVSLHSKNFSTNRIAAFLVLRALVNVLLPKKDK